MVGLEGVRRREGERRSKLKGNARRGGADSFGSARVSWIWRIRLVCSPRRGAPRRPATATGVEAIRAE